MKKIGIIIAVFITQMVSAQLKSFFSLIKNDPLDYEHKTFFMKSKDVVDYEKGFNRVRIQKSYYPDDFDNYSLAVCNYTLEQKNKKNQVVKRQFYLNDKPEDQLTKEFRYKYNENNQLISTEDYQNTTFEGVKLKLSYTYIYEYNVDGNIHYIKKYTSNNTIEMITEYNYKNELPVLKIINYYNNEKDKINLTPSDQEFEFYKYDEQNRFIEKIKQYNNHVKKRKRYYDTKGRVLKIEEYSTRIDNKRRPYYVQKESGYFNENDARNEFELKVTEYYKKFDKHGNVTEILWEDRDYNDKSIVQYFLLKREYNYNE